MTSLAQSLLARMRKELELMQSLNEHLKAIQVQVTSRDKSVTAEVNATGELLDLKLGPKATKLKPEALAILIVQTAQAAAQVALERQGYLYNEFQTRVAEVRKTPLVCYDGSTFVPRQPR